MKQMGMALQRVEVYLEFEEMAEQFTNIVLDLKKNHVAICFYPSIELDNLTKQNDCWKQRNEMRCVENTQNVLYIVDSPDAHTYLQERELPVLVFFHEKNRTLHFTNVRYAMEEIQELDTEYLERIYRRFKDLPWFILETDRCLLRETTEEDVDDFFRIYAEESITTYTEKLFPTKEAEIQYAKDYKKFVYEFYEHGIWTVLSKETGEIIGRAGIAIRDEETLPEVGFVIDKKWQGKHIATEVIKAILSYGKNYFGYDEMQAFVHPKNEASLHLLEKLGFKPKTTKILTQNRETTEFIVMLYRLNRCK